MNMKKYVLAFVAFVSSVCCQAQTEKNVIIRCSRGEITYVEPKEKKETVGKVITDIIKSSYGLNHDPHPEFADNVRDAISGAIGSARRIRVVDSQFLPGELAEDEPALNYTGSIGAISCATRNEEHTDDKGKKYTTVEYCGSITATINLKDVRTDEIVKTINFSTTAMDYSWLESPEKAIGNAIQRMQAFITKEINLAWPMYASIVEGERAKKDKQKEVYIDLGEQNSAFKGMTFTVYSVKSVAGREAKKEIGRLKIEEVMGDDISLCKVTKGGVQIKECLDNGEDLLITSTN